MKKILRLLSTAVLFVLLFSMSAYAAEGEGTVRKGVFAGDIDLGGMTEAEAQFAIESYVEGLMDAPLTLKCAEGNTVTVKARDMGLKWDNTDIPSSALNFGKNGNLLRRYKEIKDLNGQNHVFPIELGVDEAKVKHILSEQCSKYDVKAVDAELIPSNDGTFTIVEGKNGESVEVDASVLLIESYVNKGLNASGQTMDLMLKTVKPKGDYETLSKIKDKLGTFTTSYPKSSSDRCANIAAGCGHINGTLLYPGEQFSVYEAVNPFTEENGYRLAGTYVNGLVVESLGGGICQVSSTLYQAVLRAELQVDQRSNHSMVVDYVPHSGDAAIAGTSKDFKFTNNTDYPIYIAGSTGGKQITFSIYGVETRPSNRTLAFESIDITTEEPGDPRIVADASQPAGYTHSQSAHTGYSSEFWKIVKENGVEVSRERVNKSYYKAMPRILTVGTATDNDVTRAAINNAIATNNADYCRQVAASIKVDGGAGAFAEQQAAQAAADQAAADPGAADPGATDPGAASAEPQAEAPAEPAPAPEEPAPAPEPEYAPEEGI